MKSFLKYSKTAFSTLVVASAFAACGDEIEYASYDYTTYAPSVSNIKTVGKAVDLDLPSGTKWADMNVGAASASDNGLLLSWGDVNGTKIETAPSFQYFTNLLSDEELFNANAGKDSTGVLYDTLAVQTVENTIWLADSTDTDSIIAAKLLALAVDIQNSVAAKLPGKTLFAVTKYNKPGYEIVINQLDSVIVSYKVSKKAGDGSFDKNTHLYNGDKYENIVVYNTSGVAEVDPATANWGSEWRMPTTEEMQELLDNCKWEFDGNGYTVTRYYAANDSLAPEKSIYLPAAGYRYENEVVGKGNAGYYAVAGSPLGTYNFPSMEEQYSGSKGSVNVEGNSTEVLIFNYGKFDKTIAIYNNLTTNYALSVRPVKK